MPPSERSKPSAPIGARSADPRVRLGTQLGGKWSLDALLGTGGTSAVYAGTHRNGLRGAVKVLRAVYSHEPEVRRRFLSEGCIANKVDHPGAVRVLDDDVAEDGCAYLVMELLEGEDADEWAARAGGRLGVPEVLWLAWHLLDVLAAAHAKNIVHRDVKPDNVFVTKAGVVKVLDFGLACVFDEAALAEGRTETGGFVGTPAYMAPEQARGRWELVDAQSDLWSVGATMFTLLTGRFVHEDRTTPGEMMAATYTHAAPSLATMLPSAPLPIVEIVDCALEREKGHRFLDARSMQAAIAEAHHVVYGVPLPVAPTRVTASSTPPARPEMPSGRPSHDGLFSFTSSSPRSEWPLAERTMPLLLGPPGRLTRSAPAATPRRRRPGLALAAGLVAGFAVASAALLTIQARQRLPAVAAAAPAFPGEPTLGSPAAAAPSAAEPAPPPATVSTELVAPPTPPSAETAVAPTAQPDAAAPPSTTTHRTPWRRTPKR